jgi:hypothetical protein
MNRPGALPPGTRIADLELDHCIGATPIAFEYAARSAGSGSPCRLLEYMPAALAERRGARVAVRPGAAAAFDAGHRAFQLDADRLSLPRHESLVVTRRLLLEHGTVYTQLPAEAGPTLAAEIGRYCAPVAADDVRSWLRALATALGRLHRAGGVHGSVSPERIERHADGRIVLGLPDSARWALAPWLPELIDADDPSLAPEQLLAPRERAQALGPWTDVYALATIAHLAIAGRLPPPARRRDEALARPALASFAGAPWSPAMLMAIDRALSPDTGSRPRDMDDFLSAMGLLDRRLRPRAPGEGLLTHVLDPVPAPTEPRSRAVRAEAPAAEPEATPPTTAPTVETLAMPNAAPPETGPAPNRAPRGGRIGSLLMVLLFVLLAAVAIWAAARAPAGSPGAQRPSEMPVSTAVRSKG